MKELNLALYRKLYLIRRAEDAIREHYTSDAMKTPMHMSTGGEAICAGVCHALRPQDQIIGTYRSHGIYLAKTGETDKFFAEMYGRESGMAKGKAGSMHLTAPEAGLICTSAIVGTTIPVALGAAFANREKQLDKTVAVFFGDGAIDEGVFWETLNSACGMRLPLIFVCEDNGFAVHVPKMQRHGYKSIADVVSRFECDVYGSESTDVEEIHNLAAKAIANAREKKRPAFLHLKYYRYLEHVGVNEDFNQGYRDRKEYETWRAKDPLELQRKKLLKFMSEPEIRSVEAAIDAQVKESVKRAEQAPFPRPEELYEDVLA
jgi:acetoin:2,6-dichlorophenolindophenol oxidoreductase subunit alpha